MTPPPPLPLNGAAAVKRPVSSAVLAGWICVGIGVGTFWIFGLGFYLIGLGAICGIVAMCTHQIKAGLLLLLGSIISAGLCVVLMVVVVFGLLGAAGSAAQKAQAAAEAEAKSKAKATGTTAPSTVIPRAQPVVDSLNQQFESSFRQTHKAVSDHVVDQLRPVIEQIKPKPSTQPRPQPKPDAATLRRQKELQELRERQGN